jgi:hypothetical protein
MNRRILAGAVALSAIGSAAVEENSRLRYTPPPDWERSIDSDTQLVPLSTPGRGASVTFTKSVEFPGTAEQWQEEIWKELQNEMKLLTPPVPGMQGGFRTRMVVGALPSGAHAWICQYTLVKNGRGESVFFFAEGEKSFFEHLAAVTNMVGGIIVADSSGSTPAARGSPPGAAAAAASGPFSALGGVASPASSAQAPAAPPNLEYVMSPDFPGRQGAGTFVARMVDGVIQVYNFRAYQGNFEEEFRRTMFREWIQADLREEKLLGAPAIQTIALSGAEKVCVARFQQDYWGTPRERLRVGILASGAVAIVDINLKDADAWQRYNAGVVAFLNSIKIAAPQPMPAGAANGADAAGLWLASKSQFQPNVLGGVGSGSWQMGTEFYLLSENGRVYRGRKLPKAPGGNLRLFDCNAAQNEHPQNSGSFFIRGNQVIIRLGPPPHETIPATRMGRDVLSIYDVPFKREVRE